MAVAQKIEKPQAVDHAVKLLWSIVILQLILIVYDFLTNKKANVITPEMLMGFIPLLVLTWGVFIAIIRKIENGWNWARVALLLIFIFKFIFFMRDLATRQFTGLTLTSNLYELGATLVALALLFSLPGAYWFPADPRKKYVSLSAKILKTCLWLVIPVTLLCTMKIWVHFFNLLAIATLIELLFSSSIGIWLLVILPVLAFLIALILMWIGYKTLRVWF